MDVAPEVRSLMLENAALKRRVQQLEQELFDKEEEASDELHFGMRMVQRLIDAGLWVPGVPEEFQQ